MEIMEYIKIYAMTMRCRTNGILFTMETAFRSQNSFTVHKLYVIVTVIYFLFKWIQIIRSTQPLDIECVNI
jgi:hypothetical protein